MNNMTERDVIKADIAVIGAGSGGLSVASGAAQLGLKVVLFEAGEMGGDCLNTGCVPSKALLAAAKSVHQMKTAGKYGIKVGEPEISWDDVKAHIHGVIETIAPVDSQERFEGMGVRVIREIASFHSKSVVASKSVQVHARRIVVASGSVPVVPPIPGLSERPYITNETLFDLPGFPEHLLVLGAGPIGLEMALAFRRLGAKVTVLEMNKPLMRSDPEHARIAIESLRAEGVEILDEHKVIEVGGSEGALWVKSESAEGLKTINGSHLLVAVGRAPVLDALQLEAGGVEYDRQGIKTKTNLRSVSNPKVWAIGDIAGRGQFTHLAGWHASVFVQAALMKVPAKAVSEQIPAVTYIDPELAQIGLTEPEARQRYGDQVKVSEFALHENDRAIAERKTTGSVHIVIGKGDKILGASILGEGAGDILQILSLAMANKLKMRDLTKYISPYPTRAEIVKRAASLYFQPTVFGPMMKKLVSITQRIP